MAKGPQFVQYFGPVLDVLRDLGNSGTPEEVRDRVAAKLNLPDQVLNEQMASGQSRFDNQVAWARFYLAKAGYIDSSQRGVWRLTERGQATKLDQSAALRVFKDIQSRFKNTDDVAAEQLDTEGRDIVAPGTLTAGQPAGGDYHQRVLEILRNLPASGFERFCMLILREAGFRHVEVTGRAGDSGIDGHGLLQVDDLGLVRFRVLFQCKRYKDSNAVSPSEIRDFRGAMTGRADKGIFITTSTFTRAARHEAVRDGAPPLELVDATGLVELLEKLKLGLVPRTTYDVHEPFFEEFRSPDGSGRPTAR